MKDLLNGLYLTEEGGFIYSSSEPSPPTFSYYIYKVKSGYDWDDGYRYRKYLIDGDGQKWLIKDTRKSHEKVDLDFLNHAKS
jgi:hypothetical protein